MIKYKNKFYNTAKEIRALIGKEAYKEAFKNGEVIVDYKEPEKIEMNDIKVYHFQNTITGYTITSIYADLSHLNYVDNLEQWIKLD